MPNLTRPIHPTLTSPPVEKNEPYASFNVELFRDGAVTVTCVNGELISIGRAERTLRWVYRAINEAKSKVHLKDAQARQAAKPQGREEDNVSA